MAGFRSTFPGFTKFCHVLHYLAKFHNIWYNDYRLKDTAAAFMHLRCLFIIAMDKSDFESLFQNADETKRKVMSGLVEEAYDCKCEIIELKEMIREMKEKGARFTLIAKREKLLIQKRASYTNMMSRICKELCAVSDVENFDDLMEYE